jgi:hypothetical protein
VRKPVLPKNLTVLLGEHAVITPPDPEAVRRRREVELIAATEEKMIAGASSMEPGYWDGSFGRFDDIRFIELDYAALETRVMAALRTPPRQRGVPVGLTILDEMHTMGAPRLYSKVLGLEYAKSDAELGYFVLDTFRDTSAGSDVREEPARHPHTVHQHRFGRQGAGPLRTGAVLQASRRGAR